MAAPLRFYPFPSPSKGCRLQLDCQKSLPLVWQTGDMHDSHTRDEETVFKMSR